MTEPLLFELSSPGRVGCRLPDLDVPESPFHPIVSDQFRC